MSLPRFLVSALPHASANLPPNLPPKIVTVEDSEAHHAIKVLRCKKGESVVVFDGAGNEATGVVHEVDKKTLSVAYSETLFAPRDHDGRLCVAISLPKGDRQKYAVEKLVELGVDRLIPLATERSVAFVDESNVERLHRHAMEACKQCQRNRLMTIEPTMKWSQLLSKNPANELWMLHPYSKGRRGETSLDNAYARYKDSDVNRVTFAIGPEGGFTDEEAELASQKGVAQLSLGERILRVETAVAFVSVLGNLWLGSHLSEPNSPKPISPKPTS